MKAGDVYSVTVSQGKIVQHTHAARQHRLKADSKINVFDHWILRKKNIKSWTSLSPV